jgi:hypothetical protein
MILPHELLEAQRKITDVVIKDLFKVTEKVCMGLPEERQSQLTGVCVESTLGHIVCSLVATFSQSRDLDYVRENAVEVLHSVAESLEAGGSIGQKINEGEELERSL